MKYKCIFLGCKNKVKSKQAMCKGCNKKLFTYAPLPKISINAYIKDEMLRIKRVRDKEMHYWRRMHEDRFQDANNPYGCQYES